MVDTGFEPEARGSARSAQLSVKHAQLGIVSWPLDTPDLPNGWCYPAREAARRPDLRFHDLRHTQAVLAAATGATLAELMARLGHSTPGAAMRYQHAPADRDRVIAAALSDLAGR